MGGDAVTYLSFAEPGCLLSQVAYELYCDSLHEYGVFVDTALLIASLARSGQ